MTEIELLFQKLDGAQNYLEVFGPCAAGVKPEAHIKKAYRRLARKIHPDKFSTAKDKELAQEAFKRLAEIQEKAKRAAAQGRYGEVPKLTIRARKLEYEVGRLLYKGEIADLYQASVHGDAEQAVLKVGRVPRDNDLLATEARALKSLSGSGDKEFEPFFPRLTDTFAYRDNRRLERRANVLEDLSDWHSLEEIRKQYAGGVSPLDMVWIWRRVLWTLGYAHSKGLLHAAVWPSHILVLPEMHGVKLADWCYSQTETSGQFAPIRVISGEYQDRYPKEVTEKLSPSFATDIYMAAWCMVYLMGGETTGQLGSAVPRAFKAFFASCLEPNQKVRPDDAWKLLAEFDELLEHIGSPYFPRRFHEFTVPNKER